MLLKSAADQVALLFTPTLNSRRTSILAINAGTQSVATPIQPLLVLLNDVSACPVATLTLISTLALRLVKNKVSAMLVSSSAKSAGVAVRLLLQVNQQHRAAT